MSQITELVDSIDAGDPTAAEELLPLVYNELRQLAHARMARERGEQTLQPTGLVHEAYARLVGGGDVQWNGRRHFFGAASQAMRRILIERARRYARLRHGGDVRRTTLNEADIPDQTSQARELLALDTALDELEKEDPQMAEVVKLRFFAGLTVPETARALQTSARTVNRRWTAARAWLSVQMRPEVLPEPLADSSNSTEDAHQG